MLGRKTLSASVLAVAMAAGSTACTSGGLAVRASSSSQMVASRGGQVPAGTTLWLRLGRGGSYEGQAFQARVASEVVSTGGDVLIPRGALVHGFVSGRSLELDSIDMAGVRQPISGFVVEQRGAFVAVRLTVPIESYASLSYRRYY